MSFILQLFQTYYPPKGYKRNNNPVIELLEKIYIRGRIDQQVFNHIEIIMENQNKSQVNYNTINCQQNNQTNTKPKWFMLAIIFGSLKFPWTQTDLIVSQEYTVRQLKSLYSVTKKVPYYNIRLLFHSNDYSSDLLEDDQTLLKDCGIEFGNDILYRRLIIGCASNNICFVFENKKESAILNTTLCNGRQHKYLSNQVKQLHKGSAGYKLFYQNKCIIKEKFERQQKHNQIPELQLYGYVEKVYIHVKPLYY